MLSLSPLVLSFSQSSIMTVQHAPTQSPGPPFGAEPTGGSRLVLVRCGETQGTEDGRLLGQRDTPLSTLGDVHANKTGEFLMDLQVRPHLLTPPNDSQSSEHHTIIQTACPYALSLRSRTCECRAC